jgi:hypothetical protein
MCRPPITSSTWSPVGCVELSHHAAAREGGGGEVPCFLGKSRRARSLRASGDPIVGAGLPVAEEGGALRSSVAPSGSEGCAARGASLWQNKDQAFADDGGVAGAHLRRRRRSTSATPSALAANAGLRRAPGPAMLAPVGAGFGHGLAVAGRGRLWPTVAGCGWPWPGG